MTLHSTKRQRPTKLQQLDLSLSMPVGQYRRELVVLQRQFGALLRRAQLRERSVVIVVEGWDASGKSGLIRRLTAGLNPMSYRVIGVTAPTATERRHRFLWRFRRDLVRRRSLTIFDRSWYGRILVERVEKLVSRKQWEQAYSC